MTQAIKPIMLIILDGWGVRAENEHNPTKNVPTPVIDELMAQYPHTELHASGTHVGLPAGQIGNSEVGHIHIGAGRKVPQDLTRINDAISEGEFFHNKTLLDAISYAQQNNRAIHLLGLVSHGGVHSHVNHYSAMLKLMAQHNMHNCFIHAFLDGRDTAPQSAQPSLQQLMQLSDSLATGRIVSVIGRYYAMDRDQRWQRTKLVYDLVTAGKADYTAPDALTALALAYQRGENDEFVKPTLIQNEQHPAAVTIQNGDVIIFMNFRADRARQLCYALYDPDFNHFERHPGVTTGQLVTLTEYAKNIPSQIAFPAIDLSNGLGEYLAQQNCRQLRAAETEKYAHVTYFINGGRETPFENEDRILIPSPKVATYDLQPEMSAIELTDKLINAIESQQYDAIICNYANPDMIGHTGIEAAAEQAVAIIDQCLGRIIKSAQANSMQLLITADHGNIEQMYNPQTGQPHTAHTNNLVPLIYVGQPATFATEIGALDDIAPTLLHLMGLASPPEMTGRNLITLSR